MPNNERLPDPADDHPTPLSVLQDLLDCTELNMDDLEEHTRIIIAQARAVLKRERSGN